MIPKKMDEYLRDQLPQAAIVDEGRVLQAHSTHQTGPDLVQVRVDAVDAVRRDAPRVGVAQDAGHQSGRRGASSGDRLRDPTQRPTRVGSAGEPIGRLIGASIPRPASR